MDTEKCRVLFTVIQQGSFSAAAKILGYTPSGVMRSVNGLEEEVGFSLLERSPQGVNVTKDGERILPMIRRILHWEEQIRQVGAQIAGLDIGNVAVGTYFSVAANWLPQIIKSFQMDYPQIHVAIEECGSRDMYKGLEERRLDCCITTKREFSGEWIALCRDEMMVWLPAAHRLAKGKAVPVEEIAKEPFIRPLPGHDTDVEKVLAREGILCQEHVTSVDNYTTYRMVEAGLGISMNNKLMTASWHGQVTVLPMDPPHYIELGIAVPSLRHASPAVKRFIAYVKQWVQENY